jgi:hypothetical protein
LSLEKEVEIYRPEKAMKPVDVNENSAATLYEAFSIILKQILRRQPWAIAIGRRVSRGEMDPVAKKLGRL